MLGQGVDSVADARQSDNPEACIQKPFKPEALARKIREIPDK